MTDLHGERSLSEWLDDLIATVTPGQPAPAYVDHALRMLPRQYEDQLLRPGLQSKISQKLSRRGLVPDVTAGDVARGLSPRVPMDQLELDGVIAWCRHRLTRVHNDEAAMRRELEAWCATHPGTTVDQIVAAAAL